MAVQILGLILFLAGLIAWAIWLVRALRRFGQATSPEALSPSRAALLALKGWALLGAMLVIFMVLITVGQGGTSGSDLPALVIGLGGWLGFALVFGQLWMQVKALLARRRLADRTRAPDASSAGRRQD